MKPHSTLGSGILTTGIYGVIELDLSSTAPVRVRVIFESAYDPWPRSCTYNKLATHHHIGGPPGGGLTWITVENEQSQEVDISYKMTLNGRLIFLS